MIQVEKLTKSYGYIQAISNLNFHIPQGTIAGFLGPNGAGKTTTLRILTCFLRPTSGTAIINGLDISKNSLQVRKSIGYLPENSPLYLDMRVEEYLLYRMKLKGVPKKKQKSRLEEILEKCHLQHMRKRLNGQLSKGYRQRVGFADAICHNPPILLLDEPTAGMDPKQKREIHQLIQQLSQEHTVLFSTHILPEVEALCQKIIIIHNGHIVADDTTKELQNKFSHSQILLEINAPESQLKPKIQNLPLTLQNISKLEDGFFQYSLTPHNTWQEAIDKIYQLVKNTNWKLRALHRKEKSLEEIFIQLTS